MDKASFHIVDVTGRSLPKTCTCLKTFVSIFSTFEGTCAAVDSFEKNPGSISFRKDANDLIEGSDNLKLLQKEDGYIVRSEESFGHVRSYHLWHDRKIDGGTTTQTSETETGGDSGRDTKESPSSESPYSYEATTDTEWIELKDWREKSVLVPGNPGQ